MKTITNKTHRPLSVPLPRGKTLFLGPGKTGQIASDAVEHAPLKKMIDAGEIEVLGEGHVPLAHGRDKIGPTGGPGPASGGGAGRRSSGDR
jgi:hypothetical protein